MTTDPVVLFGFRTEGKANLHKALTSASLLDPHATWQNAFADAKEDGTHAFAVSKLVLLAERLCLLTNQSDSSHLA